VKSSVQKPSLTIVVPVFNEAATLPGFLDELIPACAANGWRVIFVDDGSTDESAGILSRVEPKPFVRVLHHKVNRGYGGALKSGMLHVTTSHLVTVDSDGQHTVADVEKVFYFAQERDADLVVGDRGRVKNASPVREFGKWIIRNFTRLLMPLPIHDLNSGFKLYRTELAQKYLQICPDSMAFSDVITLAFISQKDLVLEIPISVRVRKAGKSTIGIHTALETVLEIVNIALLFNPLKIFLPISLICFLMGFGWGVPLAAVGRGVSVGAMLAIVLGALFFAIGLLASQLSAIRMEKLENTRPMENRDQNDD
jgi:glycosyltransferase involved in cell wall biosynthesis